MSKDAKDDGRGVQNCIRKMVIYNETAFLSFGEGHLKYTDLDRFFCESGSGRLCDSEPF